ncbi:MAG: FAD-dependent oxidoreductase [Nitrososphaerales archaeon]
MPCLTLYLKENSRRSGLKAGQNALEVGCGTGFYAIKASEIVKEGKRKVVKAMIEGEEREFEADQLLMATGRKANTKDLALENAGVKVREDGAIIVNEEMQATAPHIWAAGDVIGEPMLETAAAKEGSIAAENALTNSHRKVDFLSIPRAIFTSPQVATVGLTDRKANERGYRCACNTIPMSEVPKAHIIKDTRGLIKMVIDADSKRVLGVHILASNAADIIMEGVYAVKYKLTIDDIIDTVHIFPTLAESIKLVATSFKKDIRKLSCCVE